MFGVIGALPIRSAGGVVVMILGVRVMSVSVPCAAAASEALK